jgi:catechol 2,3-dioxygenase-like lactoylglutathione lyase family enzyme
VLGHLGLNVSDLRAAKAYYDELMALVGFEESFSAADRFAYRPAKPGTHLLFYEAGAAGEYDRLAVGLQHVAFAVATRSAVRVVHDLAVRRGDRILDPPREFPQYPPPYYATFWLDPNGFKLEAVCHHDRD